MRKLRKPIEAGRAIFASVLCLLSAVLLAPAAQAAATITGVKAAQRYPWNGKVDIEYTASNVESAAKTAGYVLELKVTAVDRATTPWTTNVATKTALSGDLSLADGTHTLVWDLDVQGLALKSTNVVFAVLGEVAGVQLWKDGPYWATCNVGATKPQEYGYYFWWGDTVGYTANTNNATWDVDYNCWEGVTWVPSTGVAMSLSPFNPDVPTHGKINAELQSLGYTDSANNLVAAYDAATVHLGAPWRMPTVAEMAALCRECDKTWMIQGGVYGYLVVGRDAYASRSIFLPVAGTGRSDEFYLPGGVYWSSSAAEGQTKCLSFSMNVFEINVTSCYPGLSVRPLRGFAK